MFDLFSRGRKPPSVAQNHQNHQNHQNTGSRKLHEAKLLAWAILIGERRANCDPPCRSRRHRGMLDDLPQPETPELAPLPVIRTLVGVIERLLAFRSEKTASGGWVAGYPDTPVGETVPMTYIDRSDADESHESAPAGTDRKHTQDRAA